MFGKGKAAVGGARSAIGGAIGKAGQAIAGGSPSGPQKWDDPEFRSQNEPGDAAFPRSAGTNPKLPAQPPKSPYRSPPNGPSQSMSDLPTGEFPTRGFVGPKGPKAAQLGSPGPSSSTLDPQSKFGTRQMKTGELGLDFDKDTRTYKKQEPKSTTQKLVNPAAHARTDNVGNELPSDTSDNIVSPDEVKHMKDMGKLAGQKGMEPKSSEETKKAREQNPDLFKKQPGQWSDSDKEKALNLLYKRTGAGVDPHAGTQSMPAVQQPAAVSAKSSEPAKFGGAASSLNKNKPAEPSAAAGQKEPDWFRRAQIANQQAGADSSWAKAKDKLDQSTQASKGETDKAAALTSPSKPSEPIKKEPKIEPAKPGKKGKGVKPLIKSSPSDIPDWDESVGGEKSGEESESEEKEKGVDLQSIINRNSAVHTTNQEPGQARRVRRLKGVK